MLILCSDWMKHWAYLRMLSGPDFSSETLPATVGSIISIMKNLRGRQMCYENAFSGNINMSNHGNRHGVLA